MEFYLAMKAGADVLPPSLENVLSAPVIKLGRGEVNDVVLPDARRLVSSRHAEIRSSHDQCVLQDVGSTNGSQLNGELLETGKAYPLSKGDEIGIGPYVLVFHPADVTQQLTGVNDDSDATICLSSSSSRFELVVEQLRTLSRKLIDQQPHERVTALKNVLTEATAGLEPLEAESLLAYVEATFPDTEYQQEQILTTLSAQSDYVETHAPKVSRSFTSRAVNSARVEALLTVFLQALTDALNARRMFQQEMEVEVTRILSKNQNPIKWADSTEEITSYLFDQQRSDADFEVVLRQLREALQDLALQPMGIMAGLRECVRGILRQLDPVTLESEAKRSTFRLNPLFTGVLNKGRAWDRFIAKHQSLLNEEANTMKHVLREDFGKGYLSVYGQQTSQ